MLSTQVGAAEVLGGLLLEFGVIHAQAAACSSFRRGFDCNAVEQAFEASVSPLPARSDRYPPLLPPSFLPGDDRLFVLFQAVSTSEDYDLQGVLTAWARP